MANSLLTGIKSFDKATLKNTGRPSLTSCFVAFLCLAMHHIAHCSNLGIF